MTLLYPATPSSAPPAGPKPLPPSPGAEMRDPREYRRDPGLVDAVNVALLLRQPLMVTGEPGTGKTVLAASIAFELGLGTPLTFETKSTSQARDLFYIYDTLGRFTAKELASSAGRPADYITYNALGERKKKARGRGCGSCDRMGISRGESASPRNRTVGRDAKGRWLDL